MRGEGSESGSVQSRTQALGAEIEETKRSLEKAREEANSMASSIKSLKEELQRAQKELQEVKARELKLLQQRDGPQIEHLKFIANSKEEELQKKRYVKFASPPALTRLIVNEDDEPPPPLHIPPSQKKPKKKPVIPLFPWLLVARKKGALRLGP